jgi:hypothetical protein
LKVHDGFLKKRIFDTRRNVTNPLDREKKALALPCHFWVFPSLNDSLDKKDELLPMEPMTIHNSMRIWNPFCTDSKLEECDGKTSFKTMW